MKVKGWQIAVIVLGLLVGTGSAVFSFVGASEVRLPHESFLIDAETGDLYRADTTQYQMGMPAPHPVSGRALLIGVAKDDSGIWFVPNRCMEAVQWIEKGTVIKGFDPQTGDIQPQPTKVIEYKRSK